MADAGGETVLRDEDIRPARGAFVGTILGGRYKVQRRIGSGGMADVYEVSHVHLGSPFAAKVLRSDRETSVRRFLREARLLAQLKSDHIVTVFDVSGADDETPFYIMELLNGQDLRCLLAATPEPSLGRAVKIVSDACLGLSVAHVAGVVHRDLKPENLFVTHRDSGEELVKLLDFGVAKAAEGTSTEHGALIGTVRYMAPEQIEHAGIVSPRADVRGLGAILYECLAGRPPHVADSVERLLFKVLNERIEPVRTHRPNVPAELDAIILRALERDPSRRFPTARAFAEALRPFSETRGLGEATIDTTSGERKPVQTRRLSARLGIGVGIAVGAALSGALALNKEAPSASVARLISDETIDRQPPSNASIRPLSEATMPRVTVPPLTIAATPKQGGESLVEGSTLSAGSAQPSYRSPARDKAPAPAATATPSARGQHLASQSAPRDAPPAPVLRIETSNPYDR